MRGMDATIRLSDLAEAVRTASQTADTMRKLSEETDPVRAEQYEIAELTLGMLFAAIDDSLHA